MVIKISPQEIVDRLASVGIEVSRPTLLRYEKQGLVASASRGSSGRGIGRWSEYPEIALAEAYAAWSLLHGNYADIIIQRLFNSGPVLGPHVVGKIRHMYSIENEEVMETGLISESEEEVRRKKRALSYAAWMSGQEKPEDGAGLNAKPLTDDQRKRSAKLWYHLSTAFVLIYEAQLQKGKEIFGLK